MICQFCNQKFLGDKDPVTKMSSIRCKMNGMKLNEKLYERKWQDPRCPVMEEYNQSMLNALKEAANL